MRCSRVLVTLLLILVPFVPLHAQARLKLSTTTSTQDTGLLDVLLPPFERQFNVKVDVIVVGTGKALKIAENGDVDVVLVHARALEDKFVQGGFGVNRKDVMYNDFVIVGPPSDPAGIKGMPSAAAAIARIAAKGVPFISRGDESGTHQKERELWTKANIKPAGAWYVEVGQGMGATLQIADEKRGYCLADRGTFLAFRKKLDLTVLVENDPILYNPYGIIAVNPAKWPHVNYKLAMALIDWVTSAKGQRIIAEYKRDGEPLFKPLVVPQAKLSPR